MYIYKKPQCILSKNGIDVFIFSIKFINSDTFKKYIADGFTYRIDNTFNG